MRNKDNKLVIRMSASGVTNGEGNFDWEDALIDASIAAGVSFFGTLAGIGVAGLWGDPAQCLVACLIAAGGSFFAFLAAKRGVVVEHPSEEPE